MRKFLMLMLLVFVGAGCATLSVPVAMTPVIALPQEQLTPGMTRAEAVAVMAAQVVVGYEADPASGVFKPVKAQNLYSAELITVKGTTYQVDRYIVREPAPGTPVDLDILFPVVYKDGILTAKGRDGLAGIMANEK